MGMRPPEVYMLFVKTVQVMIPKNQYQGYIYQVGDSVYQSGNFKIDVNEIKALTGKVKRGFRPSAIAKNPITSDWYILSAVNKLLVVADSNWKIKGDLPPLNSNTFNQPEGIAFDKNGTMYISNEGDDLSQGNILSLNGLIIEINFFCQLKYFLTLVSKYRHWQQQGLGQDSIKLRAVS
jgi:hypothetical protein